MKVYLLMFNDNESDVVNDVFLNEDNAKKERRKKQSELRKSSECYYWIAQREVADDKS